MSEDTLVFYHAAPSRSSIVHWMLEEVGAPYRIVPIDLGRDEQRQPAYLAVNPMGKVPAIVHRGTVITEVAAICCYLADAFPSAGLAPSIGDPLRGPYLRWSVFEASALEPAIIDRMFQRPPGKPSALGYGDFDTTMEVVVQAVAPGPPARRTVLGCGRAHRLGFAVGRHGGAVPERAELAGYLARLSERPALQRAMAKDKTLAARTIQSRELSNSVISAGDGSRRSPSCRTVRTARPANVLDHDMTEISFVDCHPEWSVTRRRGPPLLAGIKSRAEVGLGAVKDLMTPLCLQTLGAST